MKSEKQRLTRIINIVKDKFPDGNDIYTYSGVTKEKVLASLNKTYLLFGLVEDYDDEIETVWLKRKLAKQLDELSQLLKEIDSEKWIELFDRFLDLISKMRVNTKDIYITLSDKPLRSEEELQQIRDHYSLIKDKSSSIEDEVAKIVSGSQESVTLLTTLNSIKTELSATNEKSKEILKNVSEIEASAQESEETINELSPQLKTTYNEAKEIQKNIVINDEKILKLITLLDEKVKTVDKTQATLLEQLDKDEELQEQIQQTLQDVNKHGMAGAFLKRKNELRWTVFIWGLLSVLAMGVLIGVSYKFAIHIMDVEVFDFVRNLFKIPSVIAGVWLCWFCAKQFGYTIRIREDYSFKYAISMAFEGYKNETREIDENLLKKLLEVTVANISINPVVLYNSKTNHGSPWHELTDGIKSFFKVDVKADITANTSDLPKI